MLFGSAVVVAILLGAGTEPTSKRSTAHLWLEYEARPTPLKLDLKAPPIEFKSIKVVGAAGFGLFVPICETLSVGAGVTTFKVGPGERATQSVAAIRIRF
jgi:hypothetical protein